jgi:2-haloacid dehalogenase
LPGGVTPLDARVPLKKGAHGGNLVSPVIDRWATFDCYGTLIDWRSGIEAEFERLFGPEPAPHLLDHYLEIEVDVQRGAYRLYGEVLGLTLERLVREEELALPEGEEPALARALPDWSPFPETREALGAARERGWKLAVLSNSDRDLIAASIERIGVDFDHVVVAEDVRSYKPAHAHWERFFADTGAEREHHAHVAASLYHDIAPARELGLRSVWINRLGEEPNPPPDRELHDLSPLADALDELAAASS